MSWPAACRHGPCWPQPVTRPYTSLGLRARQASGPIPSRSATPGRNPSSSASAEATRSRTTPAPSGCLRSAATERRPRSSSAGSGPRAAPGRSTRTTSAPRSARTIPQNGPGPIPATSTTRTPASGPMRPPSPGRHRPMLGGAGLHVGNPGTRRYCRWCAAPVAASGWSRPWRCCRGGSRMSSVQVRPFRRDDREQLTKLVNAHVQAVVPGASVSVNTVLSQLERAPGEFIVDPWVAERVTLVAEQRRRVVAAAHLLRYRAGEDVGESYRDAGEIGWLLYWPQATYWPDSAVPAPGVVARRPAPPRRGGGARSGAGGAPP